MIAWPVAERASRRRKTGRCSHARDQLLDPEARDVQRRQRGAEIGVALVRAHDDAAGLGDREVHAGEAGLRGEELLAQVRARHRGERGRIVEPVGAAELAVEQRADLGALEVDRREHDVARRLAAQLHDPLAEVGVDHLDAARAEVGVQAALLGEHRLALHDARARRAPRAARARSGCARRRRAPSARARRARSRRPRTARGSRRGGRACGP